MLYNTFPGIICLITGSVYLLTTFTHFAHPPSPASSNHQSILHIYKFEFKSPHIHEIIQYLYFSVWLISLSVMMLRFIHVGANGKICFFLWLKNTYFIHSSLDGLCSSPSILCWIFWGFASAYKLNQFVSIHKIKGWHFYWDCTGVLDQVGKKWHFDNI